MKIAITGKGGVGKTTLTALFARRAAARGKPVLVIDADPNPNLHLALGLAAAPPALVGFKDLIEERLGSLEGFFRLNPRVDDIPERFSIEDGGVRLLVMGGIDRGGSGCACPQSAFLRNLMLHVMLERSDWVFIDCEAGLEHLGRATARGTDALIVVVEPTQTSIETGLRIQKLAADIGLSRLLVVGNKVRDAEDREVIGTSLSGLEVVACIPENQELRRAARSGAAVQAPDFSAAIDGILDAVQSKIAD